MKFTDFIQNKPGAHAAVTAVVDKLVQIVRSRYECELIYQALADLSPEQKNLLCSLSKDTPALLWEGRAFFPVCIQNDIVGAASVNRAEIFNERSLRSLRALISLVLESVHLAASSLEVLQTLETHLRENTNKSTSNIVHLRSARAQKTGVKFNKGFRGNTTFNVPCLIHAQNFADLHKMALEIHEFSRRYAFVHFDQLNTEVREDAKKLRELGNITLFIPDLTTLQDRELFALMRFFEGEHGRNDPQFIAGTLHTTNTLLERRLVPAELLRVLGTATVNLQEPFESFVQRGLKEILLPASIIKTKPAQRG